MSMRNTSIESAMNSSSFASTESAATIYDLKDLGKVMQFEPDYVRLSAQLISFFKNRIRPIDGLEFKKKFEGEITPNQKLRLFAVLVKKFSLQPTETFNYKRKYSENSRRYIFDVELRNSLATRLTPERVEILCLDERVFRKVGRRNPAEEAKIQARIEVLLGHKVVANGEFHPEVETLADVMPDLTPMSEETISPEEKEIAELKAQLESLQKEVEQKQAALDKKNRLIKTGKEILEMFNISVEDLKEITSLL